MPLIVRVVLLLALAAGPAAGQSAILYAAAATPGRVDGYCLDSAGGNAGRFAPTSPVRQFMLGSPNTRRLVYVPDPRPGQADSGVLFAALPDRVESIRIDADGRVAQHCGSTGSDACHSRTEVDRAMDARDVAVSADGLTAYVVERGRARVAAFPLDPDTGLLVTPPAGTSESFTSCAQGPAAVGFQQLAVDAGRVYVSSDGLTGSRVDVFQTLPDGRICTTMVCSDNQAPCSADTDCTSPATCVTSQTCVAVPAERCSAKSGTQAAVTFPILRRRHLFGPRSIVIANGLLYVEQRTGHRITAFAIDALEPPPPKPAAGKKLPKPGPKAVSQTAIITAYQRVLLTGPSLIGSQFLRGRVDAYRLRAAPHGRRCTACQGGSPCCVPKHVDRATEADLRTSPVGLAAARLGERFVLYLGTGEFDRVRAYTLDGNGLPSRTHFSETDAQTGSFPNEVAVAMLKGACR
jgi:hypothetical protein